MNILGISAFYHDSAACLVRDGEIIAAAQEEHFTRTKHDRGFPRNAVDFCLRAGGITMSEVNVAVFYENPFLKFERLIETYLAYAPRGLRSFLMATPLWLKEKLWMSEYPSPFEEAAFLTIDGVEEWATTSWGIGKGHQLDILSELHFRTR